MAMKAMYNAGAQLSLGELNKNITKAGKALARVSSGMRIIGAQDDDSASFAISEKMREQIRSLLQDNQNVQNGSSMIKVAERGIDQIIQLLDHMKQLAIDAANDSNTDEDRRTLQKEFDSRMSTINDIVIGTEYNGKRLLDGTRAKRKITSAEGEIIPPERILHGGETIPEDDEGVYMLARDCTGTITVNAHNIKFVQEDPSTPLNNVKIISPEDGNANMWIKDLNITNTNGESVIRFRGTGNVLTFEGSSELKHNSSRPTEAIVYVGEGLTLEGTGNLTVKAYGSSMTSTAIGIDASEKTYSGSYESMRIDSYITVNSGNYDLYVERGGGCIGGADNSYFVGDIKIAGGNIKAVANHGSAIGCGSYGSRYDLGDWLDGTITIGDGANITAKSTNGAGIGAGSEASLTAPGYVYISEQAQISATGAKTSQYTDRQKEFYYGQRGTIVDVEFQDSIPVERNPSGVEDPDDSETSTTELYDGNPLWIQHGTQSGQRIHVYINSMRTEALGIDDAEVITRDKALDAIAKVDAALEYALNEATTQGAYLQRLEFTDSNVTIMGENVQQAESTIRDADMAREMTEYTKYNILTQSSQAMLDQANQNQSSILSLLH